MEISRIQQTDFALLQEYGLQPEESPHLEIHQFEQGEFVFNEGQKINHLYFVRSGKAKVALHTSGGKQILLCYSISSGILGDMELILDDQESNSTVQAITNFTCIALSFTDGLHLLEKPVFARKIAQAVAAKLKERDIYCSTTVLYTLEERLCAYIAQAAVNGIFLETLTEVAELLGTSYRHLLRCLDKLNKEEILKKQTNGYHILNEGLLQEKAGDLYVL